MTDLPFLRDLVALLLLSLVPDVREVERLAEVGVILVLFTLGSSSRWRP